MLIGLLPPKRIPACRQKDGDNYQAKFYLRHLNYYKLGAYWLPFESDHSPATSVRCNRMKKTQSNEQILSPKQREELLCTLKTRFEKNMNRHEGLEWADVQAKLEASPKKLWSLSKMEGTGGEPDVVGHDEKTGEYLFCDCSPESPADRRSLCYDPAALQARKEAKPESSAIEVATAMGVELLTEQQYRDLQKLGEFDLKTSSWLQTPPDIRKLGGAIFGDRRYGHVFVYHNGAQSYYAARGFRGRLMV